MDVRFRKKIREAGIYLEQFTTEFQADAGIARGSGILSDQFVQFLTHCKCSSRSPSHPGQAAPFWKKTDNISLWIGDLRDVPPAATQKCNARSRLYSKRFLGKT
jgi:hypothetical protein